MPWMPWIACVAGGWMALSLSAEESLRTAVAERSSGPPGSIEDPHRWLEEVEGDRALEWVRRQNAESTAQITNAPAFEPLRRRLLAILDSRDRIPHADKRGELLYNFWRDESHPRGLFRRTTLEEYRREHPAWETVVDLDQLAAAEKESWVWKGDRPLWPDYDRTLLLLSRGGADAVVAREFDLRTKSFVPGGFALPEAKIRVSWRHRDALYVGTDFGPGSMTRSGYPRLVKEWRRGTPLSEAALVFTAQEGDVGVSATVVHDRGFVYELVERDITFFSNETLLRQGDQWRRIEKPDDATVSTFADQLLITLRSDWAVGGRTYPAGALLAAGFKGFLDGNRRFDVLFEPGPRQSLADVTGTRRWLIVNQLENVRSRLYSLERAGDGWRRKPLDAPALGQVAARGIDPDQNDDYWMTATDFLTPSSLFMGTVDQGPPAKLKSLPEFFAASDGQIDQFEAVSKDGTRIPYFQVSRRNTPLDGTQPTLLYGYGGFEIPMLPAYNAMAGAAWIERGGVYVLANIRGGGEFGPSWHQAALKANRQRAYDDFIAVAEDLIRRKITSSRRLGIMGGSNGGLLMGNMLVQRPDLFGAIVCQVPLLDMGRYHKLLAGASWIGEYGNPDAPEEWAFLQRYSPYHQVRAGTAYPPVLFTSSTRDDRVHPAHARKMVARMKSQGHSALYYENIEGGHGAAADNRQAAFMSALAYRFLAGQLGLP
ncbi:MAG: S9 family peptidase [Verrucomicrobia bacterium]|nr:S9 family peptidase [Verrucomicrobiota bacterium]